MSFYYKPVPYKYARLIDNALNLTCGQFYLKRNSATFTTTTKHYYYGD